MNKKTIISVSIGLIAVFTLLIIIKRMIFDYTNKSVEISVEYNQVVQLCRKYNYPVTNFLDRIKTIGTSSVILDEETADTLQEEGRLIFFPYTDVIKFRLLEIISAGTPIKADAIVTRDVKLGRQIAVVLSEKTGKIFKSNKLGEYNVLNLSDFSVNRKTGLGFDEKKISLLNGYGLNCAYRPAGDGVNWVPQSLPANFSYFIPDTLAENTFNSPLLVLEKSKTMNLVIPYFEFSKNESRLRGILQPYSGNVIRGHYIDIDTVSRKNISTLISRWKRAVIERNCRILYFLFNNNTDIETNLTYLRDTCTAIKNEGFTFKVVNPPKSAGIYQINSLTGKLLSFLLAVIVPLLGILLIKKREIKLNILPFARLRYWDISVQFAVITGITLSGSLVINALLTNYVFFVRLDDFTGIKTVLVLPLLILILFLYPVSDLKKLWDSSIQVKTLAAAAVIFSGLLVMLTRTDNFPVIPVTGPESGLRSLIESLLIIRPRFKEFIIGHPLLLLGLWFNKKWLIILGIIGQVSIINTFLHLHTPLWVSLLRTFNGIWLGLSAGYLLILLTSYFVTIFRPKK